MVDDFGVDINLLETSPSLVRHLLREAGQRWQERQLGEALWPGEGRRCCMDVVHKAISSGAKSFDRVGKGIIRCIACDGFWGMSRRKKAEYDVDELCPLCLAAPDTLHHRLWNCQCVDRQRVEVVGQKMVDMMRRLPEDDPLATRGLFKHPADEAPRPATDGGIVAVRYGRDKWGQAVEEEVDWRSLELSGGGYPDGAFYPHPVKDLGRAGWALAITDAEGNKTAEVRGPVCAPLPQSPQAAEYVAVTAVAGAVTPGLALYPDCANVVRDFNRPLSEQINGKKRYAGLLKAAQRHSGWYEAAAATWQKAHLDMGGLHGVELLRARGNGAADRSAKQAATEGHAEVPVALDRKARWQVAAAEATLKVAAAVLRLFPQDTIKAPRMAVEPVVTKRRAGGHSWCMFHGGRR